MAGRFARTIRSARTILILHPRRVRKILVNSWAQSFFAEFGIPVVTARAGNVIGGGDWSEDRIVPDIWRAINGQDQLRVRHPRATRPWQHAIEPLAGYLRYVEAAASGGEVPSALNFGPYPDDVLTVGELVEAMFEAFGVAGQWCEEPSSIAPEMQALALDPSRAGESIGWHPRLSSRQAIAWTAEWYSRLAAGEAAVALCREQIARYEALS